MHSAPAPPADEIGALQHRWREATVEWLEARAHFERLQAQARTDSRTLIEAAQRVELTALRRATLIRDAAALAQLLDATTTRRAGSASER